MVHLLSQAWVDSCELEQASIHSQQPKSFISYQKGYLIQIMVQNDHVNEREAIVIEEGKRLDQNEYWYQEEVASHHEVVFDFGKGILSLLIHLDYQGVMKARNLFGNQLVQRGLKEFLLLVSGKLGEVIVHVKDVGQRLTVSRDNQKALIFCLVVSEELLEKLKLEVNKRLLKLLDLISHHRLVILCQFQEEGPQLHNELAFNVPNVVKLRVNHIEEETEVIQQLEVDMIDAREDTEVVTEQGQNVEEGNHLVRELNLLLHILMELYHFLVFARHHIRLQS